MAQGDKSRTADGTWWNGRGLLRIFLCAMLVLLPFKFGFPAGGQQEQANFPMDIWEWIFLGMWPLPVMTIGCGAGLLWAVVVRMSRASGDRLPMKCNPAWLVALLAALPLAAGVFGLVHTTEWNYAFNWLLHFFSVGCLAAAVWIASLEDRKMLSAVLGALAFSGLVSCVQGWYQHFIGLEQNLEMMKENSLATGVPLTETMLYTLSQTRIYGSFVDPNIYAAHVLLTAPPMLYVLWRVADRIQPVRVSRVLLPALGALLAVCALTWSGSRGGVIGLAAEVGVVAWLWLAAKTHVIVRSALLAVAALVAVGGIVWMNRATSRDFTTASIRLEYYGAAMKMFFRHPVCGVGLGEFFPWHMKLKPAGGDEARDAHSQFFSFLSQCGIPGGLAALFRLAFPALLALGWLKRHHARDKWLFMAVCAAWLGWNAHSMMQFDEMIPASCVYSSVIGLLAFHWRDERDDRAGQGGSSTESGRRERPVAWFLAACACLALGSAALLRVEYELQAGENAINGKFPSLTMARVHLAKAAAWQPGLILPWRILGDISFSIGDDRQAEADYRKLVAAAPHRASFHLRMFKVLLLQGRKEEALQELEIAREWYPNGAMTALYGAGEILWNREPRTVSEEEMRELFSLDGKFLSEDEGEVIFGLGNNQNWKDGKLEGWLERLNACDITMPDGRDVRFAPAPPQEFQE